MARRRNKLDYFAFFPKDCEADETIRKMDDAQFGFWMRCLCLQWSPRCSIPADPNELRLVLMGRATGGGERTAEYIQDMLAGPPGERLRPHPEQPGRLADPRQLSEREIAEEESSTNKKNRTTKDDEVVRTNDGNVVRTKDDEVVRTNDGNVVRTKDDVFVEGKTEKSCDDSLFCSVSVLSKKEEVEHWFDSEFWPTYPKKADKPHALNSARAKGKTPEARAAIMTGLRAQLLTLRAWKDKGVCPNPGTWLNGERWNDEVSAVNGSGKPTPITKPAPYLDPRSITG